MELEYANDFSPTDYDDDKPGEECGCFGVWLKNPESRQEAARVTFFGLYALQHRGQESCGIASSEGMSMYVQRGMGLVSQVFTEATMASLLGSRAVGHTRYSTKGGSELRNAQPFVLDTQHGPIALAHNGNITKYQSLRQKVLQGGVGLFTTSDSELIAQNFATINPEEPTLEGSVKRFMRQCQGAYSLVVLSRSALYGLRDMFGLRPLCVGQINKPGTTEAVGWCIASESCALTTVGAKYVREVRPGELLKIDDTGITSISGCTPAPRPALCSFEFVYFARPDSVLENMLVHTVRQELGRQLAVEHPCPGADAVMPVPDSSIPAAIAYAQATGIPFMEGLTKNRYIGRTFIQPDERLRKKGVMLKFNPLPQNLAGKKVVIIDDSVVRGTTLAGLVNLLREGGAKEVHVRVSSPPVRHPCYMGIDMSTYDELIAHKKTVEEIAKFGHCDSLGYLSLEGMMKAIESGMKTEEGKAVGHCNACWSGNYPLDIEEMPPEKVKACCS
jgi:amidophosphoribosyltransferase